MICTLFSKRPNLSEGGEVPPAMENGHYTGAEYV